MILQKGNKMKKYIFTREPKTKLTEMAKVGTIGDLSIQVYTDHEPIHFHLIKTDKYEARIDVRSLKVLSYKWQKDGATLSSNDIKKVNKWLDKPFKNSNITNRKMIKIFWNSMNK